MGIGDSLNLGVSDAVQAVKSAAGIVTAVQNTRTPGQLPWQISNIQSKFFQQIQIDPSRWDQLYPYRLLVIDAKTNTVVSGPSGGNTAPTPIITVTPGTGSALITFLADNSNWIFQLPITPKQLNIQDEYAIQTTMTLRGVLEEHSGVRVKMINAQGSMGVWPQRSSVNKPPGTPGIIQSVFGGTIQALGSVVNQVNSVINTATTGHPANKPVSLRPETSTFGETSTGYYQALKLEQFLEQYSEAKKDPNNATWRLVFDIPKQNQSFVVTPITYDWDQSLAMKPNEVQYKFQLKAWRRINLAQTVESQSPNNQPISPGILQRILQTLSQARQATAAALNLIGAVQSDVEAPLNVLRQTTLFVKNLAGVAITAADLPYQIQTDYASSIAASMVVLQSSIQSNVSNTAVNAQLDSIVAMQNQNEGLTMAAVSSGQLGSAAAINQSLSPVNNIFTQPQANFTLMDQVPVTSLSLNNAQQKAVTQIVQQASQTSVATLKQYRQTILQTALLLSNSFGTGSAYYNFVFMLPPPKPSILPITLEQYDLLKTLYDVLASYDILTATTQIDDNTIQTNMEYVAGLAAEAGITFNIPSSKILVPVPFGLTIEAIAARYLDNPLRWVEIATLNNLRDPYIDENGFQLPLLSNANGRNAIVGNNTNLYIGQKVMLQSATQTPSGRTILNIDRLSDTSFLLTFDGLPNLDNFKLADMAYVQAYLPGTVNSQQKIFIPSNLAVPNDSSIIPPPSTASDPLTALSKVDWLLTDAGDLAVNNYGDFRYSSGITNIIQALRIKFGSRAKTLLTHPTFGLNVRVGSISSELQLQDLYNSINEMISQDPRFQSVSNLQITLNGPVLGISLGVSLPGQTGVFPVSFALAA